MSILRRAVFYEKEPKGQIRFIGWAEVTTTLGSMMEPHNIADRHTVGQTLVDYDFSDPMARVDELRETSRLNEVRDLSHGETMPIHGGNLMPRTLIATGNF